MASLGVSLDGRGSGQSDSVGCEPRQCASKDTLSELDLAHVCKCVLGRQQVINDLIYYKGRIFLVPGLALKDKILHACHKSPVAGHQGIIQTYMQVRERFS